MYSNNYHNRLCPCEKDMHLLSKNLHNYKGDVLPCWYILYTLAGSADGDLSFSCYKGGHSTDRQTRKTNVRLKCSAQNQRIFAISSVSYILLPEQTKPICSDSQVYGLTTESCKSVEKDYEIDDDWHQSCENENDCRLQVNIAQLVRTKGYFDDCHRHGVYYMRITFTCFNG